MYGPTTEQIKLLLLGFGAAVGGAMGLILCLVIWLFFPPGAWMLYVPAGLAAVTGWITVKFCR